MSALRIVFADDRAVFSHDGVSYTVPVGVATLTAMITTDPPLPEELTNAIGLFMDHLEDVDREVPGSAFADEVEVCGAGLQALVDTEVGHAEALPCALTRDAVEEVFRTMATEATADRLLNPGLPAGEVHRIVGVSCALVAVLRALQAPVLTVVAGSATP